MDMWLRPVSESYCATCSVDAAKRLEMGDEGPRNGMWYSASGYSYHRCDPFYLSIYVSVYRV